MKARAALARRAWPGLLGAAAVLALLFLFQLVVKSVVTQGALRRDIAAQRHSATWHCKALRGLQERQDCLLLIVPAAQAAGAGWPAVGEVL